MQNQVGFATVPRLIAEQGIPMAASEDQKAKQLYEFGPFRLDPEKELLLRDNEAIPLTPKALQVLLVLIRSKKEVVTKDDLLKAVWPDTFVEETNLSRNVFLLRKALGESPQDHQYIVTVPGRGYRFAEEVQLVPDEELIIVATSHSTVQVKEPSPGDGSRSGRSRSPLLPLSASGSSGVGRPSSPKETPSCSPISGIQLVIPSLMARFARGWRFNWNNRGS
jgi:DNA-binding winged helix-turn-helix (wHTH) protein